MARVGATLLRREAPGPVRKPAYLEGTGRKYVVKIPRGEISSRGWQLGGNHSACTLGARNPLH